ncbi:MAG: hypothetical protein J7K58_00080 [Euryarchaeota archaeon]|nr:hypothetical protein [Euryarchaeota archaeon]
MPWKTARAALILVIIVLIFTFLASPLKADINKHIEVPINMFSEFNKVPQNKGTPSPEKEHPIRPPKNPLIKHFPINIPLYGGNLILRISEDRITVLDASSNGIIIFITNVTLVELSREMHFLGFIGKTPHDIINVKLFPVLMILGNTEDTRVIVNMTRIEHSKGPQTMGYYENFKIILLSRDKKLSGANVVTLSGKFMISIFMQESLGNTTKYIELIKNLNERAVAYGIIRRFQDHMKIEGYGISMNITMRLVEVIPNKKITIRISSVNHLKSPIVILELNNVSRHISMILLDDMPLIRTSSISELEDTPGSYYIVKTGENIQTIAVHIPHMSSRTLIILFDEIYRRYSIYGILIGAAVSITLIGTLLYVITKEK